MGTYEKNQVKKVLEGKPDGYYKIKVTGRKESTNWMHITKYKLKRIQKILAR